jgi:hypothetical protein
MVEMPAEDAQAHGIVCRSPHDVDSWFGVGHSRTSTEFNVVVSAGILFPHLSEIYSSGSIARHLAA